MIETEKVVEELCSAPSGAKVLVWKDGKISWVFGEYAGEQDGNDPLLILNRNNYGDITLEEALNDADLWNSIEEEIAEAGGEYHREGWK